MKGLKKFKLSIPECDRDGIVKMFDMSIYYANMLEKAKAFAQSRGDKWSQDCSIYKASLYAYEDAICLLGLWNNFIEYRKLKEKQETAQ
jgi:hypothetical protein